MLRIKERPGSITAGAMRGYFEAAINSTPAFKENTPLGIIEINDEFSHYSDPDTDTMWLGFALGMRAAERIAAAHRGVMQESAQKEFRCPDCGCLDNQRCNCPDSPMSTCPETHERAKAIAEHKAQKGQA